MTTPARQLLFCVAILLLWPLTGCGGYQLQGRVIEGATPGILVVSSNDRRLDGNPIADASVRVTVDPDSMKPRELPPVRTDADGYFTLPIKDFGAGALEYNIMLLARASGFRASQEIFKLPGGGKRVLVILSPGRDTYRDNDILGETMRLKEQLESR